VNGSDHNNGSKESPLATIAAAIRKARELRRLHDPSIAGGIHIIIDAGTYSLYESLFVRPEDAGTADSPTTIEGLAGTRAVISGGVRINHWYQSKEKIKGLPFVAQGKIWIADLSSVESVENFRQLWVNDVKAIRAKDCNGDSMSRILSWNHQAEECWIPNSKILKNDLSSPIEMFIHQWWAVATLRIKKIEVRGDSSKLSFFQPESKIESEHPWPAPWISKETGNSAFYLTNAIEFLDEPGEWYFNRTEKKLYYWPRAGEQMTTAIATIPLLENIVKIEGTVDRPVSNIIFKNLSFAHTGWMRPSEKGHVPLQAGMYLLDAYKLKTPGTPDKAGLENQAWIGRQAAAVSVYYANHVQFQNCSFEHMAATGLDLVKGTHDDSITGSFFNDIGGTAIQVGTFSDEAFETHLPYDPSDEREICTNENISNNLITDATNEDWGCVGIGAGYVRNINIDHNEVSEVSYSGICVGWGWTRTVNAMRNNKIHANKVHHYAKHMYDVGGLYTLSAMPGTLIDENYIDSIYKAPYAHDPKHWFYYYLDEGSSYITIKNNWSPSEKVMRNSNGPGNVWENNGPTVSDSVKRNAGLQSHYRYLYQFRPQKKHNTWPINQ
jgi:hypothetical protein